MIRPAAGPAPAVLARLPRCHDADRVPNAVHAAQGWIVSEVAAEFTLLDVWRLPATGGRGDFAALVGIITSLDPEAVPSRATRLLFRIRRLLGALFGWDATDPELVIPGTADASLRGRLPERLRDSVRGAAPVNGFVPLFFTEDEWAAEISNATVHGVLQVTWVDEGDGVHRGRLAVYVRARGALGAAYLAVIAPFRHLIVYPALLRAVGAAWAARDRATS